MKTKLIIVGTGDYALLAHRFITEGEDYEIISFSEEKEFISKSTVLGLPNIPFETIESPETISLLIAIGPNKVNSVRERIYLEAIKRGFNCITFIHPSATVFDRHLIGQNTFIFPNVTVEPFAQIGNNCVLWSNTLVAHHCIIGDNCFLAPSSSISGRTTVGKNTFVGINATIHDYVKVGERCIIGGGAVIKHNCNDDGVYSSAGTPLYHSDSFNTKL